MLSNVESLSRALSTYFELLYTNMYHIGPADGAAWCYMLRFKIYGGTSMVPKLVFCVTRKNFLSSPGSFTYSDDIYGLEKNFGIHFFEKISAQELFICTEIF